MTARSALVPVLLALAGCGFGDAAYPGADASGRFDSGARDGGFADAGGPPARYGPPIPAAETPPDRFIAEDSDSAIGIQARTTCWDGRDDYGDGLDCDDPDCELLRSCCVGHGDCCAPEADPGVPDELSFTGCASPAECNAALVPFGDPQPWVSGDYFFPGGDVHHSGVVVGAPIDLTTRRVKLTAVLGPAGDSCGLVCLESVGVALTGQADLGATEVRPMVGLLLSGSRDEVSLVVAGETVERFAVTAEEMWSLTLRPTGELTVERSETVVAERRFFPAAGARLVLYGRSRNPTAFPDGARIGGVTVDVALCDVPAAWSARGPLTLDRGGLPELPPAPAQPSLAYDDMGRGWLAFEHIVAGEPRIAIARRPDEGVPDRFVLFNPTSDAPELTSVPHAARGASEPELLFVPGASGGQLHLYFTAHGFDGVRSIGRARISLETGSVTAVDAMPVVHPGSESALGFDGPTVAVHDDATVLIVRAHLGDAHELWTFVDQTGYFIRHDNDLPDTVRSSIANPPPGYDAVEVAAPSLTIHNGAWQLSYARRRGTRWSVGLVTSDELVFWRHIDDGRSIFEASGNGFDRLGAAGPDVVSRGDRLEMVYTGLDGTSSSLGRALRDATDSGAFR